jgi:uncharacterized protein YjdB
MMKRFCIFSLLVLTFVHTNAQIIADHRVVSLFADIPQEYLDSVKTMLVSMSGESHSQAYRFGMDLLEEMDGTFQVETFASSPVPAKTDQNLRIGGHRNMGEDYFFSQSKIASLKAEISSQNSTGNPFHVMGFGWCWDMTDDNDPGGTEDPVYQVRWAGRSEGGPEGNMRWGLDNDDQVLTGNSVCMDTYLEALESYIQYCKDSAYSAKWIFTTGPVDHNASTENGFQREIKHDYIRAYVNENSSRILFDYADILCWNNVGEQNLVDWDDEGNIRPHAQIHPDNMMDYDESWNLLAHSEDGDHIGEVGAVRLAKAMWWMLARLVGWDGRIPVSDLQFSFTGDTSVVTGQEILLQVILLPEYASNKEIEWSVIHGSGTATVSQQGVLRGQHPGKVKVIVRALDGSGVTDTLGISILEPPVPVAGITIAATGGDSLMVEGDTLRCWATVLPEEASNPSVIWSINNISGSAQINQNGLLTALEEGIVQVIVTAEDGSGITGTLSITIETVAILVSEIDIFPEGGVSMVDEGSTLQFTAAVRPDNASNKAVVWSVEDGSGTASISESGMLSAISAGTVDVVASARDASGVSSTFALTISGASGLFERKEATIQLFPNPSTGKFDLDAGDIPIDRLELISMRGIVLKIQVPEYRGRLIEVDLSDRQPGVYFIHVISGDHRSVHRIILNR